MPNYPFERAYPLGVSLNAELTSAKLNTIDSNAAAAADGSWWTDVVIARNWSASLTLTNHIFPLWDPYLGKWWTFGHNAGTPVAKCSYGGQVWTDEAITLGVSVSASGQLYPTAADGEGHLIVAFTPSVSSAIKIRQSADGGATWNSRTVGSADTIGLNVAYISYLGMFVAGYTDAASNNIYTSVDGGATWTQRTTPNTDGRASFATNGQVIVAAPNATVDRVLYSADGISWTAASLPSSRLWRHVVWVPNLGKFILICSNDTHIASSEDGVNWTTSGLAFPGNTVNVQNVFAYGRVMAMLAVETGLNDLIMITSIDGGVSWKTQYKFSTSSSAGKMFYGDAQLLVVAADQNHFVSLAAGF